MSEIRENRLKEAVREIAAQFVSKESNRLSLITITDVSLSDRGNKAKIFFTVLPVEQEDSALDFLKRKREDFRQYFKENIRMRSLPFFDFEIDKGEKNRQKIDELSRNS